MLNEFKERRLLGCYAVWLLLRSEVSEERIASIIRVTRICELGTTLALTNVVRSSPNLVTLKMEVKHSSETSFISRVTEHNVPEDCILHSHRR
jgi:hypothetical protein